MEPSSYEQLTSTPLSGQTHLQCLVDGDLHADQQKQDVIFDKALRRHQ